MICVSDEVDCEQEVALVSSAGSVMVIENESMSAGVFEEGSDCVNVLIVVAHPSLRMDLDDQRRSHLVLVGDFDICSVVDPLVVARCA